MSRARLLIAAGCLLTALSAASAQEQPIEVPFEAERNLIFVEVKRGRSR